nr:ribonuclease H-like domain, reverse transcriptase, RNA-dependent DNA polymerase [Tanacetum cinerariifolium]
MGVDLDSQASYRQYLVDQSQFKKRKVIMDGVSGSACSVSCEIGTSLPTLRASDYFMEPYNTLKSLDFNKCALEQAIYTRTERDSILLVGVYVDDLIITGTPKKEIDKFKDQIKEIFDMSDLGLLAYYPGIEVTQSGGLLSRFMQEPKEQHMKAIKKVLRYVKGTKDYGITYKHNGGNKIHGYSDSSNGVNTQEGKGTTGIIFYYEESPISWST